MKTVFLALVTFAAGITPAWAHGDETRVARDSVIGAVAGALIGGHNGDRWAQGAVIGAAAGAVVGATIDQPRHRGDSGRAIVVTRPAPVVIVAGHSPGIVRVAPPGPRVVYVSRPRVRVVACSPAPVVVVRGVCAHGWSHRHRGCGHW